MNHRTRCTFRLAYTLPFLTGMMLLPYLGSAQTLTVTCPPSVISVPVDPNSCSAVVNYSILYSSTLVTDTTFDGDVSPYAQWQVPAGVQQVSIELWGAQGNKNAALAASGGLGGHVTGDLSVIPGEWLYFEIGLGGDTSMYSYWGGYNGGSDAGYSPCTQARGGGGGGATDVRQGGSWIYDRVMVAGGGGGAGGNRVQGCGRGTGGGGGGGWYGGGGGAAWPYNSSILPTGGTQNSGGNPGQSSYSGNQPQNNGQPGSFWYGGYGGEELQSSQAGNGTGANGGDAGGFSGAGGTYSYNQSPANNFTGQSGAGGSSYFDAFRVLNGNMLPSTETGNGRARVTFPSPVITTYLQGQAPGSTYNVGSHPHQVKVKQAADSTTCVFSIDVYETTPPDIYCPANDSRPVDGNCSMIVQDYTSQAIAFDNCDPSLAITQSPLPSALSGGLSPQTITMYAEDNFGLKDSCTFTVTKYDAVPPTVLTCPQSFTYVPDTLDCEPPVFFTPPTFTDNCPGSLAISSTHAPGGRFLVGTTTVSYLAVDQAGFTANCTFNVIVEAPRIDSIVEITYSGPCEGDTVTLVAEPGYSSYLWSNNTVGPISHVTTAGTYNVRVGQGLCLARDTFVVTLSPAPIPTIVWNAPVLCTSQPYTAYQWYRVPNQGSPNPLPGAIFQCYQPTQNLLHYVEVTHANGCVSKSAPETVVANDEPLENAAFEVYPNPAGDLLYVKVSESILEEGELRVLDIQGKELMAVPFEHGMLLYSLDLNDLASGSYFVELRTENYTGHVKFAKID